MIVFIFIYFLVYGGLNYYVFRKIHAAWGGTPYVAWIAGIFIVLMVVAPFFIRLLERHGAIWPARVVAFVGYTWMAVMFWFVVLGLAGDLWNVSMRIAGRFGSSTGHLVIAPRPFVVACALIVLAASIWGGIEASRIRVKEVRIRTPKLAASNGPFRVVQISDVHLSLLLGEGTLQKIAALVESARPDVLVSTGDLSDGTFVAINHLGEILQQIPAPRGKFACFGNHEQYAGLEGSIEFHQAAGFRVLRGTAERAGPLIIAGVDDPAIVPSITARQAQEKAALDSAQDLGPGPVLLLKHQPRTSPESLGRFDLQLSGHAHGGQIFPFGLVVYATHKVWPGLHELAQGSSLYLSRGTGTWGPPFRVFAPPEVTLIILEPA